MSLGDDSRGARGVRFGCGALLGGVLGFGLAYDLMGGTALATTAAVTVSVLVCGAASARWGDRFWEWIARWY